MIGDVEPAGDRWKLRFTRNLPHPAEKVWRAITEAEHIDAWFPDRAVGDWTIVGAPLRFESKDGQLPAYWHECLDWLAHELDGTTPGWGPGERWGELHPGYVEKFGPEASTIGPPEGMTADTA